MNYYNEHDPKAAAWLRCLIDAKLIPEGVIDERSIADVKPDDLLGFTQCHFFAGIGGWSRALRLAGWDESRPVWTGSCPCQPFSAAGKQLGTKDPRHLWPEFVRLISECNPATIFGEQVASKAGREWLAGIRVDLEELGYAVGAADLCAASCGAPHIRQRLFWMAVSRQQRATEIVRHKRERVRSDSRNEREIESLGVVDPERERGRSWEPRHEDASDARKPGQTIGRMAESNGGNASAEREQRSREQRFEPQDGCDVDRMANAEHDGRRTDEQGRGSEGREVNGRACRMADGEPNGCEIVASSRLHENGSRRNDADGRSRIDWSRSVPILCRDGKGRRIPADEAGRPQSILFPLVNGLSGRVGLLRGSGNAIVPEVAAIFIEEASALISKVA